MRTHASMADDIKQKNKENKVMVYAKSYCPYCQSVISLFDELGVNAKVVQLDQLGALRTHCRSLLSRHVLYGDMM